MKRDFIFLVSFILVLSLVGSAQAQLPDGWSHRDIGTTGGDASESNGTWTLNGDGADIWGTSDGFHYAYLPLKGAGVITARVVEIGDGTNDWAKAGVMIRETFDPGSKHAMMVMTALSGAGKAFQCRPGTGGSSFSSHGGTQVAPPFWVRLERIYDTFTAYYSSDGVNWVQQPSSDTTDNPRDIAMAENVYIGLCLTSHANGEIRTATFDNVEVIDTVLPKAYDPSPPDGAKGVLVPLLEWSRGETAAFHDIYFGTTPDLGPEDFQQQNRKDMAMYWHVPGLVPGTTYYWRIDEVEADGTTVHTGDVWSFTALGPKAYDPSPPDGAQDLRFVTLAWSPGQDAAEHRVYIGSNFDAVSNGDPSVDKGTTDEPTYTPDLFGATTYYWRIDETDSGGTTHEGDVWSFSTMAGSPGTALREWWTNIDGTALANLTGHADYPGNPTGSEYVDLFEGPVNVMDNYGSRISGWLIPPETAEYTFWICTDDQGQLRLSTDEDPANATMVSRVTAWAPSREFDDPDVVPSAPIALEAGKKYYIEGLMKEGGGGDNIAVAWQGGPIADREVIDGQYLTPTPYEMVTAHNPSPTDGATDVMEAPTLEWMAGANAAQHDVYLGTDATAVANATTTTTGIYRGRQNTTSFSPGVLQWDTTHYWRIDEVNNLHPDSPWPGSVWSFTTADFMIVDDFEDYTDFTPDRIWQTWRDGYGYNEPPPGYAGNGTGSQVGNDDSPFTEQTTVHGGLQAMTFRYTNNGSTGKALYSETEREFTVPQDWTKNGVKALSLWFNGDAANSAERLYVGVQDSLGTRKDVPHENANAVLLAGWQEWNIDLQQFANAGVNLTSIKKMYIGVGNRLSPQMGGTGTLYFDDIRVYKPRCLPSLAKADAELSGDCVVDYADLEALANEWLGTGYLVAPTQPSTAGLVAHYTFEGNANDVSGNGHNATPTGMPTYAVGKVGQAINLNGVDQFLETGKTASQLGIGGGAARTTCAWVFTRAFNGGGIWEVGQHTNGQDWSLRTLGTTNQWRVQRWGYPTYDFDVTYPSAGTWVHFALVYDGSAVGDESRLYADGVLIGSQTIALDTADDPKTFRIGQWNNNFFNGLIDELRLYNRVLTQAEIASLAGRTEPYSAPFDLNVDGAVDFADYAILMGVWLDEVLWP